MGGGGGGWGVGGGARGRVLFFLYVGVPKKKIERRA